MLLKEVTDIPCGLRYMLSELELCSGASRRVLFETEMMTLPERIAEEHGVLREFLERLVPGNSVTTPMRGFLLKLSSLKDMKGVLNRLGSGIVLDDVDLFEIKRFAMLCSELRPLLNEAEIGCLTVPDTEPVIDLLDPDGLRIPSFFVYDSYDDELRMLRRRIAAEPDNAYELTARALALEDGIRRRLTVRLNPFRKLLEGAFSVVVRLDITLAKARQIRRMDLVLPRLPAEGDTVYEGLFNPEVEADLAARGKDYQKVDIRLGREPVCIVGANMGGKTVVLKCLALCQLLCQFGFGVPAAAAAVVPVERVCFASGDCRPERAGLSSFAGEVRDMGSIIGRVRSGEKVLALIDEPARTTNPAEGRALAEGLMDVLGSLGARVALTTHYNLHSCAGRRLKVRGLTEGGMDYSLEEIGAGQVPHEALAVAEMLGADTEWIETARKHLNETQINEI